VMSVRVLGDDMVVWIDTFDEWMDGWMMDR
jgi:hypothetical protein